MFCSGKMPQNMMAKDGMATSPKSLIDAGAEPVYGDLKMPDSLVKFVKGDVVIHNGELCDAVGRIRELIPSIVWVTAI